MNVKRMLDRARAFLRNDHADGTTSGGIRIALWALAGLAMIGFLGARVVYPMLSKANNCATAASGLDTGSFTSGTASSATC